MMFTQRFETNCRIAARPASRSSALLPIPGASVVFLLTNQLDGFIAEYGAGAGLPPTVFGYDHATFLENVTGKAEIRRVIEDPTRAAKPTWTMAPRIVIFGCTAAGLLGAGLMTHKETVLACGESPAGNGVAEAEEGNIG